MNITSVKFNPVNYKNNISKKMHFSIKLSAESNNATSFLSGLSMQKRAEIAMIRMNEDRLFEDFLLKSGKVSKEEYGDIKLNHPSVLLKAQKYCDDYYFGKTTPHDIPINTLRVHKYFKENYKNYRIISLGTSPSPVTEQLANMGHEVIFLPVSGLRLGYLQDKTTLGNMAEMRALMQYLDYKDIDDGKLNVVLDFISSGKTLNITTKFIKEYFNFNHKKLSKASLGDRILDFYYDKERDNYVQDMLDSEIEKISNVPHYPVTPVGIREYNSEGDEDTTIYFEKDTPKQELFEEFESYSTPLARCFALCTMAEIDKLLSEREDNNAN